MRNGAASPAGAYAQMDNAILACYGWTDIKLGHAFHKNERGQTRYTISPDARREVLLRLLELNLRIAAEKAMIAPPTNIRHR